MRHGSDMPEPDKVFERHRWDASADAWDRWADPLAEPADRLNRPLLEALDLRPGLRLLDLATGGGEPALTAADRLGPAGSVTATDIVPAMLAIARRRAADRALSTLRFAVADMECLPFPAAGFDRVSCRFGLMFVPHPALAVAECRRVLVPGGRAAFLVWGPMADNTLFRELAALVDAVAGPDPARARPVIARFSGDGQLAGTLSASGLREVVESPVRLVNEVPADRPFWMATLEMAFAPRLARLDAEARARLHAAAAARFAALADGRGLVRLDMSARLAIGTA